MRDHSKHIELSREKAVEALLARCDFHPAVERVSVREAFGRTLAADVTSLVTMPNALTCRMDSVALHFDDFEGLDGADEAVPDTSSWVQGQQWQFANTGVAMPAGFDTALPIEAVEVTTDEDGTNHIVLRHAPHERGAGTKEVGSELRAGDVLARAHSVASPILAAGITSGGVTEVDVLARPRVAFIPTGSELVPASPEPPCGKNIESNSVLLQGKIEQWGGEARIWPIVPDGHDTVSDALREAVASCDIVVINGGSSKGSDDWTCEVLEELGEVLCHETAHGPGHHSSMSVVDGTPVIGISGPPGGTAFTTDFYLLPVMEAWFGRGEDRKSVV